MITEYTNSIQQLYVAYFGRPAETTGLAYWEANVAASNGDTSAISAAFSRSPEYLATYANKSPVEIVNAIYVNLFGRPAEFEGLTFWAGKLENKEADISTIIAAIVGGASAGDQEVFENKGKAAAAFTDAIDTAEEVLAYNSLSLHTVKAFIAGVTGSESLEAAIDPANLDAVTAALVAVGTPPVAGVTYLTTKGLDNFVGGTGNDTIIGAIDSAAGIGNAELNTLSGIDLINGGAGIDTLKIAHNSGAITLGNVSNVEIVTIDSAAVAGVTVDTSAVAGVTNLNITKAVSTIVATAAATTNVDVSLKDVGTVTVNGGKDVNVALTDAKSVIDVGATGVDAVGAVTITATGTAAVAGSNVTMGNINVGGGKTVNVTQHANFAASKTVADATVEKVTQGNVVVTASGLTTDVTIKQDADVTGLSRAAIAGATEVASVKFTKLAANESVTVGGLTFTAAKDLTAAQVAQAFANLSAGAAVPAGANGDTQGSSAHANGTFSGSLLANWTTAAASDDTVVFTGRANNTMTDLTSDAKATVTKTTEGVQAVSARNTLGVETGTVTIAGAAALANVTVDGYKASTGAAGITGTANTALNSIKLSNGGSFEIDSAAATLALTLNNVDGTVTVAAGTKTINAQVDGEDVVTTLASASAETVNVTGAGNVSGTTGVGAGNLVVASAINTTGMTGGTAEFVIANGGATTYTGGAAVDTVTVSNAGTAITKAIDLGAGDDTLELVGTVVVPTATLSGGAGIDTIAFNGASAAALSANGNFAAKIDGFEKLSITDTVSAATVVNMANMDGINYVISANSNTSVVAATKEVFTLDFAGSATVVGADTIEFNGVVVQLVAGDTPAQIAARFQLAGAFDDYEVTNVSGSVVTFTALVAGTRADVDADDDIVYTNVGGGANVVYAANVTSQGANVGVGAPALTIDKLANNGTLELIDGGAGVIVKLADATGTADTFNLVTKVDNGGLTFGTVDVAGVEAIKYTSTDIDTSTTTGNGVDTAEVTLKADKAISLTIDGSSNVTLTLDGTTNKLTTIDASALTGSLNVAANGANVMTITGGAGADTLYASVGANAKADIINGGAGKDVIYAGTNGAKLTGGDGNDIFVVTTASAIVGNKESNTYSEILDFKAGDVLKLEAYVGGGTVNVGSFGKLAATLNETTAIFSDFVNAAVKEAELGDAVWFSYKGDTYVVVDSGTDSTTFGNNEDLIVKLTGINGDDLSFNSQFGTAGLI